MNAVWVSTATTAMTRCHARREQPSRTATTAIALVDRAESTGMALPHPAWTTAAAEDKSAARPHATAACRRPDACHSRSSGAAGNFVGRIVAIAKQPLEGH